MNMLGFAESVQKKHDLLQSQGRIKHQKKVPVSSWVQQMMLRNGIKIKLQDIRDYNETVTTG